MAGTGHISIATPRAWLRTYHWGCRVSISLKGELNSFLIKELKFVFLNFFKYCIYSFLERGEEKEKEKERNINVCLPLVGPVLGTWPSTQACALSGN